MDFLSPSLAFIDGIGGPEVVLVMIIVLVLFGGEKLPEFARGAGKALREFKKAAAGVEEEFKRALEEDEHKKSAPPPPPITYPTYPPASTQPALANPMPETHAAIEPPVADEVVSEHSIMPPAEAASGHSSVPPADVVPEHPAPPPTAPPPKAEPPSSDLTDHLP